MACSCTGPCGGDSGYLCDSCGCWTLLFLGACGPVGRAIPRTAFVLNWRRWGRNRKPKTDTERVDANGVPAHGPPNATSPNMANASSGSSATRARRASGGQQGRGQSYEPQQPAGRTRRASGGSSHGGAPYFTANMNGQPRSYSNSNNYRNNQQYGHGNGYASNGRPPSSRQRRRGRANIPTPIPEMELAPDEVTEFGESSNGRYSPSVVDSVGPTMRQQTHLKRWSL